MVDIYIYGTNPSSTTGRIWRVGTYKNVNQERKDPVSFSNNFKVAKEYLQKTLEREESTLADGNYLVSIHIHKQPQYTFILYAERSDIKITPGKNINQ